MMKKRNDRQTVIREIVRGDGIKTQRALVDALRDRGYNCTQATISRDIAEMGLHKLPEGDLVVDVRRAGNLVVIHASSGTAQGVAAALDAAELPDILGSVAGDDTILVVAATEEDGSAFEAMIERLRSGA